MNAKVKCSNCGAEITNLNFSWGKKQWIWVIPILLISFLPMWRIYRPKGDYQVDLKISVIEKRINNGSFEILGSVTNSGKTTWENIELDAEFFTPDGRFVDEASGRVTSSVPAGKSEHFKMVIKDARDTITNKNAGIEIKIAGAYSRMF